MLPRALRAVVRSGSREIPTRFANARAERLRLPLGNDSLWASEIHGQHRDASEEHSGRTGGPIGIRNLKIKPKKFLELVGYLLKMDIEPRPLTTVGGIEHEPIQAVKPGASRVVGQFERRSQLQESGPLRSLAPAPRLHQRGVPGISALCAAKPVSMIAPISLVSGTSERTVLFASSARSRPMLP